MHSATLDAGALIALERADRRMATLVRLAADDELSLVVPAPVLTEWWRGSTARNRRILASVAVEPLTQRIAMIAGEAIAATPGATAIDAIVMASAAQRGDVVFTSDLDDLTRLQRHFPGVRILRV